MVYSLATVRYVHCCVYVCTVRVFGSLYWVDSVIVSTLCVSGGSFNVIDVCTVVIGCVSYRCGTFGILTQEEHSFLYEIQSGNCEVCSLLCVCL